MKLCPYCAHGQVLAAIIQKTADAIQICEECDTVWLADEPISRESGTAFRTMMQVRGLPNAWSELQLPD